MAELRDRLETIKIGESPRVQSRDVSLVSSIKEWTGEFKDRPVNEFLTQIETLAKVRGWNNQDKALCEGQITGVGAPIFAWSRGIRQRRMFIRGIKAGFGRKI
jgi:hypothetical protein